jgi:glycosyltransferase involved in cell wall biosynthesis
LYEIGRRLARNHAVDVFTLETSDETFLRSSDFATNVFVRPFALRRPIRFGLYLNDLRRLLDLRDLDSVCKAVASSIDAGGYDVALVDACRFMQSPAVLSHLLLPSVYYCHEPPRRFIHATARPDAAPLSVYQRARHAWHTPGRILYDRFAQQADRRNVNRATTVLTNSKHTRGLIRGYYRRDALVAPLGVDTEGFTPGTLHRGDHVLSVGALEPHKGFDFLVRSISRLPGSSRPKLVIAGNTDEAGVGADLKRLATATGVDLSIAVRTSERDLVRLYQGARVFAYSPHQEPFGLAVLEAMACGLPVVAVQEGGPLESVVDGVTGALVPRDEEAFAEALGRVLNNRQLATDMGLEGRRVAEERWSWEAAATRIEHHLAALAPVDSGVAA